MKKLNVEKGQILIILALAIVAIMGFAALAVDGSMVYNEKRQDQSTADSAALAGAGAAAQYLKTANVTGFSCGTSAASNASNAAVTTAQSTALEDAISLAAYNLSTKNGVATICCSAYNPDTCATYSGVPFLDIHTMVSTNAQTSFLKVIRSTPITTTVDAIARVYLNTSFAGGNAIYSTSTTCSETDTGGGIFVSGTGIINITGGGLYSNSCLSASGSAKMLAYNGLMQYYGRGSRTFYAGSQIEYTVGNGLLFATNAPDFILNDPDTASGPSIGAVLSSQSYQLWSTYTANPAIDQTLWPVPSTTPPPFVMQPMTVPSCSGLSSRTVPSQVSGTINYTLSPGIYSSISWNGWGSTRKLTFTPGTYCVDGSISFGGGNSLHDVIMDGVVLYLRNSGDITFGGSYHVFTLNNSTVYLNNGSFNLGSGIPLSANNIMVYVKQGDFIVSGAASGMMNAPGCNTSACGVGPSIPGVLVYMATTNTGEVSITGSGTMSMTGTIFAPNSPVYVNGAASAQTLNVQIIGRMVSVSGSGVVTMNQDVATLYSQASTTIEFLK